MRVRLLINSTDWSSMAVKCSLMAVMVAAVGTFVVDAVRCNRLVTYFWCVIFG